MFYLYFVSIRAFRSRCLSIDAILKPGSQYVARASDMTRREALRHVATKMSHCEWEIAPRRVVSLHVARIDSSSILASCRARFCRTRPYHDRKLVAKMEEEKQIESVRDQFPMLPFPTTLSIASSSYRSLNPSFVRSGWSQSRFKVQC